MRANLFHYCRQKQRDTKTFAEYGAKVRQRGREWVQEVNRHYPDITILLTFGYVIAQPRATAPDRSASPYGLLADFLDGVLDRCSETTLLVDAWERSYPYKEQRQFERAYETITKKALGWTAVPEKYRRQDAPRREAIDSSPKPPQVREVRLTDPRGREQLPARQSAHLSASTNHASETACDSPQTAVILSPPCAVIQE